MSAPGGQLRSSAVQNPLFDPHRISLALARELPVREGETLAGKYRIEEMLGRGGMGVVVAATNLDLDQRVAIKFVLPSAGSDELLERFVREARAVARLKSEHVTKVLDVGRMPSGAPYMVMELLEGCDLAALIAEHGALPVETAADYIAQACEAVAEAHSQGIVHRDIKPQNLFLTTRVGGAALVKVLDFGVSKTCIPGEGSLTQSTMMMGSPLYMSPEQMRNARDVSPRSDVWSLGVVLFELLTGRVPFDADSMPALCLKVVTDDAPRVDREEVPAELAAVVMRCLAKDPERRFRDAAELATALEKFVTPASRIGIARTRACMTMSGVRAGVTTRSAHPLAPPKPHAAKAKRTFALLIVMAVIATLASIAVNVAMVRDNVRSSKSAPTAAAVPPQAIPVAPPIALAPLASSAPELPAPSAAPVSPVPEAKPVPQKPRPAPKPAVVSDDDIPAFR